MPIMIKIIFAILTLLIGIVVLLINPKLNHARPDSMWIGGKRDPFRKFFFNSEGHLTKWKKLIIVTWLILIIISMWLVSS